MADNKMETSRRRIFAYDFDGTLLAADSLPLFLKYAFGRWRYCLGLLACSPWLAGMKLHLLDSGKAKERLVGHFVKGLTRDELAMLGRAFAQSLLPQGVARGIRELATVSFRDDDRLLIVTASIREWVEPFFADLPFPVQIVATELEDDNGVLTGRFATPNCKGAEKWRRLLDVAPDVEQCELIAFGDSEGDRDLLSHADRAVWLS